MLAYHTRVPSRGTRAESATWRGFMSNFEPYEGIGPDMVGRVRDRMSRSLEGQVAIVTGGGRGIGRAIAVALSEEGASVAVTARTTAEVDETAAMARENGVKAIALVADATDADAWRHVVHETTSQLGPVDLLINNAGSIGPLGPLWEVDAEAWRECLDTNVVGPLYGIRAVLPTMIARGRGRIINLVTGAAIRPMNYASAYTVSKTALARLTESLAFETRELGIAVFALTPGLVRTAMPEFIATSEAGRKWLPRFAGGALDSAIAPERPAALALALASGAADRLSGRIISVHDDLDALIKNADTVSDSDLYLLRLNGLPSPDQ